MLIDLFVVSEHNVIGLQVVDTASFKYIAV